MLSNQLSAPFEGSLLKTYRVLRTINPSPYMFYFSGTDVEVAGASPETLVKLENGVLHTFPLAGTRPRGKTEEEDRLLEAELLADEKELAEHNMLVDLGRNDIGKISRFGTVQVDTYAKRLMHGKQSDVKFDRACALFKGIPETAKIARYHSLAADAGTIPEELEITAVTADGEVMAAQHREYPIYGVQFHPEAIMTPDGKQMLQNFIKEI